MKKSRLVPGIISGLMVLLISSCGTPNAVARPSASGVTLAPTEQPIPTTTAPVPDSTVPMPNAQRIATTVIGAVVAGGDYLFWRDTRNPRPDQVSIYGYDLRAQAEFLITDAPSQKSRLASDGTLLVWVDHPKDSYLERILSYDLRTRQTATIAEAPPGLAFAGIAIADGVLYYHPATQAQRGLYARILATGQELLISPAAQNPAVADGILVWSESSTAASSEPGAYQEDWSLHLRNLDGSSADQVLTRGTGQGGFSGYAISGNYVVWAPSPAMTGNAIVSVYDIRTGSSAPLSSLDTMAFSPAIRSPYVAWATVPRESTPTVAWSLRLYNQQDNRSTILIDQSPSQIKTWAITRQAQMVFSSTDALGADNLYILPLGDYRASGGMIGLWLQGATGTVLDDFGGGTVSSTATPTNTATATRTATPAHGSRISPSKAAA